MPIYGLPAGVHRKALDGLLLILKNARPSPIKTWAAWKGKPTADDPPALSAMPWCRLALLGGPVRRVQAGRLAFHEERARLMVELATPGHDQGDLGDVWDAFHAALFPADPDARKALHCRLKPLGIRGLTLLMPALPMSERDFPGGAVFGTGLVEVLLAYP